MAHNSTLTDMRGDLAFLDGQRAAMTRTLRDWCAINSGSTNLSGLATMRDILADAFRGLEADMEIMPSAPKDIVTAKGDIIQLELGDVLRISKRPQAPVRVLLTGHMDTVFPEDSPFRHDRMIDDDTMNAPGAADMKGGILVMLRALETLERSRFADRVGYDVILNADEEIGSHGSAAILKGAAERVHFACVYEPSMPDGVLAGARKGSGNFDAIFSGKAAHAGREHHLGRNALVAAAGFVSQISAMTGLREGLTVNVARIDGGGPNNVVPDKAVVRFNVRVETPDDAAFVEERLARIIAEADRPAGYSAHLAGGFSRPPKPMTPALEAFFEAVRGLGTEIGLDVSWRATGGCCDGNNIAAVGVPVIDTLGVRGGAIHSADEYVCLDSLEPRAKLSALLLLRVAAGDIANPGEARAGRSDGSSVS